MENAILAVSFGTSFATARAAAIDSVEEAFATAFPAYTVRRAFTSGMILAVLRKRDGLFFDTVSQALERLAAEGCKRLICQPTHIINGVENDEMCRTLDAFSSHFGEVACGEPLLSRDSDYITVTDTLAQSLAPESDTALVLMGHGTPHNANAAYAALDYRFKQRGYSNVFVGAVEGYPQPKTVLQLVRAAGYRKIRLAPLMLVAGDHARNDLAGDGEGSWKHLFESSGFQVEVLLKGLGENADIRALYVEHVREAIATLEKK